MSWMPLPPPEAFKPTEETESTSSRLRSPLLLLGVGFVIVLVGAMLQLVGLMSLGMVTVILAVGIIMLTQQSV